MRMSSLATVVRGMRVSIVSGLGLLCIVAEKDKNKPDLGYQMMGDRKNTHEDNDKSLTKREYELPEKELSRLFLL